MSCTTVKTPSGSLPRTCAVGAFLVDTGGSNQSAVAADLQHRLGAEAAITNVTQARSQVGSSLTSVNLAGLTRLELVFAVLLAASAGGILLALLAVVAALAMAALVSARASTRPAVEERGDL